MDSSSCAVVNVSATGIMVFCTKGSCQASSKKKRSVKRLMELEEVSTLCQHLACLHANMEIWAPLQAPDDVAVEEEDGDDHFEEPRLDTDNVSAVPLKRSKL
jgi:hypothetical protein